MGSNVAETVKKVFLATPASTSILRAIGDGADTLAAIVSMTGLSRHEAGAWLLDMTRHKAVHGRVSTRNGREVVYSLSREVVQLLRDE